MIYVPINFANDLLKPQLMQVGHVLSEYYKEMKTRVKVNSYKI